MKLISQILSTVIFGACVLAPWGVAQAEALREPQFNPQAAMARLDESVQLTDQQKRKVLEIYKEQAEVLNALSVEERLVQGAAARQKAKAAIQALLTEEQRRTLREEREQERQAEAADRSFIAKGLRGSQTLAAKLGAVTTLRFLGSSEHLTDGFTEGRYRYELRTAKGVSQGVVVWRRETSRAEPKLIRIEMEGGESISF